MAFPVKIDVNAVAEVLGTKPPPESCLLGEKEKNSLSIKALGCRACRKENCKARQEEAKKV